LGAVVAAQYSMLLRPLSEQALRLPSAGMVAMLSTRARATGADSAVVHCARLVLCAASAPAIILGHRSARRRDDAAVALAPGLGEGLRNAEPGYLSWEAPSRERRPLLSSGVECRMKAQ
jgi:hypothetical protein